MKKIIQHIVWYVVYYTGCNVLYSAVVSRRPRLLLLGYHSVSSDRTKAAMRGDAYMHITTPVALFEKEIQYIVSHGYTVLSFDDLRAIQKGEKLMPKKAIAVYFDDGFRDLFENAYPVLKKYHVPAMVFLATDLIDGVRTLWDAVPVSGDRIFLSWDEVRAMQDVCTYGSHSKTHPKFTELSREYMEQEIQESTKRITEETGKRPYAFSYPYGRCVELADEVLRQERFDIVCTTQYGPNTSPVHWRHLTKLSMKPDDSFMLFKLKLGMYYPLKMFLRRMGI